MALMSTTLRRQWTRLLLAAIALGIVAISYASQLSLPAYGMSWRTSGLITSVHAGGPADCAGVKKGDILLELDGAARLDQRRFAQKIRSLEPGEPVVLVVSRANQRTSLTFVPGAMSPSLEGYVVYFVVAIAFWVVGLFVGIYQPRAFVAQLYFLFSISAAVALALSLDSLVMPDLAYVNALCTALVGPFLLHFSILFPHGQEFPEAKRRLLWLIYLPAAPLIGLEIFRHAMDYQVDPAWDWIRNLLWLEVGVYLIAAILTFFLSYRHASSPHLRRQLRVVNIGTFLGLTPFVILLILAVATNFQAFDPRWLVLSTLGLPFYLTWAILKYQFMDIDIIASRSLVYGVLSALLVGLFLLVVTGLSHIIQALGGESEDSLVLFISAMLVAILANPVRARIQRLIDRTFFRESYNYSLVLQDFTHSLTIMTDLPTLLTLIVQKVAETMGIDRVALILRDPQTGDFRIWEGLGLPTDVQRTLRFPQDGVVAQRMAGQHRANLVNRIGMVPEADRAVSPVEHEGLAALAASVFTPFVIRGVVIGWLSLGTKRSGALYSSKDLDLLTNLANQAAIGIENAKLYQEVKRLAMTDPMTNLYNARFFHQQLSKEVARAARYRNVFSLVMLDVDDFKQYNDRYGHLAGDDLLQELASVLTRSVRQGDIVARYGGEEFVMILPETDTADALVLAERVRLAISQHCFCLRGKLQITGVTVSAGVATYPQHSTLAEDLVHAADMALYRAKRRKNMVCASSSRLIE